MDNQYENHIRKTLEKYGNVVVSKKKFNELSKGLQDILNNAVGKLESDYTMYFDLKYEIDYIKIPTRDKLIKFTI